MDVRQEPLAARWPIAVMIAVVVAVVLLAAAVHRSRPSPPIVLSAPDLSAVAQQLGRAREACVAGPPQGAACAEAERLTRELAQRRRERI